MATNAERWQMYLQALEKPFTKLCKLEFLRDNGTVAYVLDNNVKNRRSKAFLQSGTLTVNLQNGQRRSAKVTLENSGGDYDFSVNKLWFGQRVRLSEGLVLEDGSEFYLPQGVFLINDPVEDWNPNQREIQLNLVDKWAALDGTLGGGLDGIYEVPMGSDIFEAIKTLLLDNKGNGKPFDEVAPVFTDYYNDLTTTLPDGTVIANTLSPYTYRCDASTGTVGEVIFGLNEMICGWVGYDCTGRLRIDPSQDDILDIRKPVLYTFRPDKTTLLGATYTSKASEMYNDVIIRGESLETTPQANGRATNYDPQSDTNVKLIGRKTYMEDKQGYYTNDICEWYAEFKLKRMTVVQKSVNISCSQIFHISENNLISVLRTDKPGKPTERHLIQGFTRPLAGTGNMTISAVSVNDFPIATIVRDVFQTL